MDEKELQSENAQLKQQINNLKKTIVVLRQQLQAYQQTEKRRYQHESDYLPYEDDPYR